MTCLGVLDRMLEADASELRGQGDTAVAIHVRECAKCRAVAELFVRGTDALSHSLTEIPVEMTGKRPRAFARPARLAAIAGLAAAVSVIAVRDWSGPAVPPTIVMQPVTVTPAISPRVAVADPVRRAVTRRGSTRTARAPVPTGRTTQPSAVTVAPTVVAAVQPALAVPPIRLAPTPRPPLGDSVSADPPAGKRASIMRTDRPGVTVVWLYD